MVLSILKGSPRLEESNTSYLLDHLMAKLKESVGSTSDGDSLTINKYCFNRQMITETECTQIASSDAIILGFPLYMDSIPSHFLRILMTLESYVKMVGKQPLIYCICVNGFYEGRQNCYALEEIGFWCLHANARFAQGIGYGAGDMLLATKNIPMGHGTNVNIGRALDDMAKHILQQIPAKGENQLYFGSPNFPRFAWKFSAHKFWKNSFKKYGLKKRDVT